MKRKVASSEMTSILQKLKVVFYTYEEHRASPGKTSAVTTHAI
jgi:hypothetical protein